MIAGERVVVKLRYRYWDAHEFSQCLDGLYGLALHHTPACEDDGVLFLFQQLHDLFKVSLMSSTLVNLYGRWNVKLSLVVEHVTWDIELCGPFFEHGLVEGPVREFGDARGVDHVRLLLGDLFEHWQLI